MRDHNNTKRGNRCNDSAMGESAQPEGQIRVQRNFPLPSPDRSSQRDDGGLCSARSRVLDVDELAAFFRCSTEKIKRRARKRQLPAFKFGKSWYVREQDLHSFIERAVESAALHLDPNRR